MAENLEGTVFVVDDDEGVCGALSALLGSVGRKIESYASAEEFLDKHDFGRPGCLVLDVRMPGMSGAELQREMQTRGIELPTIILTGHGDTPLAVQAMKLGAIDFIEKPFRGQELLGGIQRAIEWDARLRRGRAEQAAIEERLAKLTPREREVLDLVLAGKQSKAIALELEISPRTAENHRASILAKMRMDSVISLLRVMLGRGLD